MEIAEIQVSYRKPDNSQVKINNSKDAFEVVIQTWDKSIINLQEEFKVLYLKRNNQLIGIFPMSKGGLYSTVVDTKLILSVGLKCTASKLIVVHNHPSGELNPSKEDFRCTEKLKHACKQVDLEFLDHLIIGEGKYYSFADNGSTA